MLSSLTRGREFRSPENAVQQMQCFGSYSAKRDMTQISRVHHTRAFFACVVVLSLDFIVQGTITSDHVTYTESLLRSSFSQANRTKTTSSADEVIRQDVTNITPAVIDHANFSQVTSKSFIASDILETTSTDDVIRQEAMYPTSAIIALADFSQATKSTSFHKADRLNFEHGVLTTSDVEACLTANSTLNLGTHDVNLSYFQTNQSHASLSDSYVTRACTLNMTSSPHTVRHVQFVEQTCGPQNWVFVSDGEESQLWSGCETVLDPLSNFFSVADSVTVVKIVVGGLGNVYYRLRLRFSVASHPTMPELEQRFVSPKLGYVQSPGWRPDYKNQDTRDVNSWSRVTVPTNHWVMISLIHMHVGSSERDCTLARVRLYKGSNTKRGNREWEACGTVIPPPVLWKTDEFGVHYQKPKSLPNPYPGFRLIFSFHLPGSIPERLPGGEWNCSVPHWADFKPHLHCNFHKECAGGEDEATCPYTSARCALGHVAARASRSCYELRRAERPMTWNEARTACLLSGGHLASFNTREEWRDVTDAILGRRLLDVLVGLKTSGTSLPHMYKTALQWEDNTIAYYSSRLKKVESTACGHISAPVITSMEFFSSPIRPDVVTLDYCDAQMMTYFLCEKEAVSASQQTEAAGKIQLAPIAQFNRSFSGNHVICPSGHVTHAFLACDARSECWGENSASKGDKWDVPTSGSCPAPLTSLPPSFACAVNGERVPYSLVCDHRADCRDNSDEGFCVFPPCTASAPLQCGNSGQCVRLDALCDGQPQCVNGDDEAYCDTKDVNVQRDTPPPPAIVHFTRDNSILIKPVNTSDKLNAPHPCPQPHFQCPGGDYCLPVFVRCNGVYDCPGKEDEAECDSYTCPGFYRCRASRVCLHPDHVCDGIYQCPQHDDEMLCDVICPASCTCHGLALFCGVFLAAHLHPNLRYLDASGSGMGLQHLTKNVMLVHLGLARCDVTHLPSVDLPNLHSLDLSDNRLNVLRHESLQALKNLRVLCVAGNPLSPQIFSQSSTPVAFSLLRTLDLSRVEIRDLDARAFTRFPNLQFLNLSDTGVDVVHKAGLQSLNLLRVLDVRGCPMNIFPDHVFHGMDRLETVYADNYKLCCPAVLPEGVNINKCQAPADDVSSCETLLRLGEHRVFVSILSSVALLGNFASFVLRVLGRRKVIPSGFSVFVYHLSVSDFLMGVYLAIISVADFLYRGTYVLDDLAWRHSIACKAAGFLAVLSNQVCSLIVLCLTIDRFLALALPPRWLIVAKTHAQVTCALIWFIGLAPAVVPLIPMTSPWAFYSQTAICIPLPIVKEDIPGHQYVFVVLIALNLALCLLVVIGQVLVFALVTKNTVPPLISNDLSREISSARRVQTLALSHSLCRLPYGVLGLLAGSGTHIPSDLSVTSTLILLPLSSALNPCLYALDVVLEQRRRSVLERVEKRLLGMVNSNK